ncbi:MAG: hypothetical protein ABJF10_13095 [Chthoniobacter sp.]|uniref:hypothetical protein n=1 Tax=Chthoniobacter sp. TaxID=2510640 RepID=UPI0032A8077F
MRSGRWKLTDDRKLFDMSDAHFVEKPVAAGTDTEASKAARARLAAVLKELNPGGGKGDALGEKLNGVGE